MESIISRMKYIRAVIFPEAEIAYFELIIDPVVMSLNEFQSGRTARQGDPTLAFHQDAVLFLVHQHVQIRKAEKGLMAL